MRMTMCDVCKRTLKKFRVGVAPEGMFLKLADVCSPECAVKFLDEEIGS